ncbi:acetyltransferase [Rhodobacterales bacterium]|nr:acetyltransferase [Rhodobacterales bacterium]
MISFRPVVPADLSVLGKWMERPHWREWWGEPETELGYVRDMIEGRDTTRPFIFIVDGEDAGYIQVWFVRHQLGTRWVEENPWLEWLPTDAVGVDLSIADSERLSRGTGTRVLQEFVRKLRQEGHRRIIIDPDPANLRAVRAYRKAGFQEIEKLPGEPEDCLLMEHKVTEGVSEE